MPGGERIRAWGSKRFPSDKPLVSSCLGLQRDETVLVLIGGKHGFPSICRLRRRLSVIICSSYAPPFRNAPSPRPAFKHRAAGRHRVCCERRCWPPGGCEGLLASKRPGARATIRQVIGEGDFGAPPSSELEAGFQPRDFRLWNIPLKVPVMHILQDLQNQ